MRSSLVSRSLTFLSFDFCFKIRWDVLIVGKKNQYFERETKALEGRAFKKVVRAAQRHKQTPASTGPAALASAVDVTRNPWRWLFVFFKLTEVFFWFFLFSRPEKCLEMSIKHTSKHRGQRARAVSLQLVCGIINSSTVMYYICTNRHVWDLGFLLVWTNVHDRVSVLYRCSLLGSHKVFCTIRSLCSLVKQQGPAVKRSYYLFSLSSGTSQIFKEIILYTL